MLIDFDSIDTFWRNVVPIDISISKIDRKRLLPRGVSNIETKAVLKACIEARAALAELKASGRLILNQSVLVYSIELLEAQANSEIENIVTTTDRLFRFANEAGNSPDSATKEALRYHTALYQGSQC